MSSSKPLTKRLSIVDLGPTEWDVVNRWDIKVVKKAEFTYQITDTQTGQTVCVLLNHSEHWFNCGCHFHASRKPSKSFLPYIVDCVPCQFTVAAYAYGEEMTGLNLLGGVPPLPFKLAAEREAFYAEWREEIKEELTGQRHQPCPSQAAIHQHDYDYQLIESEQEIESENGETVTALSIIPAPNLGQECECLTQLRRKVAHYKAERKFDYYLEYLERTTPKEVR